MRRVGRPRTFDPDEALHRALMVFWERGYEGTSMIVLQEATGLTAPQLYRVFESKDRLFEQAVRLYQDEYGFGIRPGAPLVEAVVEYLDRAAREFTTEPGLGCFVSTGQLAAGQGAEAATAICRAERDRALDGLRRRIADAVAQGELPETADIAGLSRTIAALIQGMSVQARDGAGYEELARIAVAAEALLDDAAAADHHNEADAALVPARIDQDRPYQAVGHGETERVRGNQREAPPVHGAAREEGQCGAEGGARLREPAGARPLLPAEDQGQRQQAEGGEEEHGDLPADGVVHDEGEPAADQVKKPRLRFCVQ